MTLEQYSYIAEIVGVILVIASLVYLAIQVRQGTKATQAVSVQAASSLDQEFLLAISADSGKSRMWATYLSAPASLPPDEQLQGSYLMGAMLRRLENILLQKRLGTLSEEGWKSRQPMFAVIARSAGYAAFLELPPAAFFGKDFIEYMNQIRLKDLDAE